MKKTFSTFIILFLCSMAYNNLSAAIEIHTFKKEENFKTPEMQQEKTILSIAEYEKRVGKKMNFWDKTKFKIAQKWTKNVSEANEKSNKKTWSLLSLIFGASSLFVIWFVGVLGLLLGVAGVVFGIIGLKKEKAKVMAIIGIVLGGLLVLLTALLLIAVSTFSFV